MAITAKGLEIFGPRTCLGYDIGCGFEGTILRSSLAKSFRELNWRCCVDAFHGYTHSYDCQLTYHPTVIKGMGLEDLETLERIFSSSNQLASVTRYASAFNRRRFIELFFKQWDEDKYINLGNFLYTRYQRALEVIKTDTPALHDAMQSLNITFANIEKWATEEREYFSTLGEEPEWDIHAVAYVERLQELREIEYVV